MLENAKKIIDILKTNGYEAYLVGGCVRDKIMDKEIHDYDICTSAMPEEVIEAFKDFKVIETGLKHGTVTIMFDDIGYEVTTYRCDGEYSDGRHPDSVVFVRDLKEDLLRRDFTMNAIVFDGNKYVDYFNGIDDIENKTIRCVGDANTRFQEDALRILRAMRFASQLDFDIEENTKKAMHENKDLINKISVERIATEFKKMIVGKNVRDVLLEFRDIVAVFIPEIEKTFDFDQKNDWHAFDVYEHIVRSVASVEQNEILRLAMFFHDIGKPDVFTIDAKGVGHFYGHNIRSEQIATDVLKRLRFDNKTIGAVTLFVHNHDFNVPTTKKSVKKFMSKVGTDNFFDLLKIKCADNLAQNIKKVTETHQLEKIQQLFEIAVEVIEAKDCISIKQLAISGDDIKKLGIPPSKIYSEILNELLDKVMQGEMLNIKEDLVNYVATHYMLKIVAKYELGGKKFEITEYGKDFDDIERKLIEEIIEAKTKENLAKEDCKVEFRYWNLDFVVDFEEFIINELIDETEFINKYCLKCGSQRCEGIKTDWFDGCQYRKCLKK